MNLLKRLLESFLGEPDVHSLAQEAESTSDQLKEATQQTRNKSAALLKQARSDRRQADRMFEVATEASEILRGVEEKIR